MTQSNHQNDLPSFSDSTVPHSRYPAEQQTQNLPEVGKPWGKYLIEKKLGIGGQALVFQAYDQEGIAGHVALKVPRKAVAPTRVEKWKETETIPLQRLDHPRIIKIVDAGVIHNIPYIATRLIEGLPLDEYIKTRELPLSQIKNWMIQLAEAMAAAHHNGVTHKDIKPKNILITQEGEPLIIDFGIAGVASAYETEIQNGSSGTPAFMSPEQARGETQADHRVDIFGLGVILKILLERKGPYEGEIEPLEAAKNNKVSFAEEHGEPRLRCQLAQIANQALDPDPAKRFTMADHMVRSLRGELKTRMLVRIFLVSIVLTALLCFIWPILFPSKPSGNTLPVNKPVQNNKLSEDKWTSLSVNICFYESKITGKSPNSYGAPRLVNLLIQQITQEQEYNVVERMKLDKILKEYELIMDGHADPEKAIRLGRLLSSYAIVTPAIFIDEDQIDISLQVTGTETSKILGVVSGKANGMIDPDTVMRLTEDLYSVLQEAFPIRGRIETVNEKSVEINIGSIVRVRKDASFRVLSDGEEPEEIAELKIREVREETSLALIVQSSQPLRKGLRVEAK